MLSGWGVGVCVALQVREKSRDQCKMMSLRSTALVFLLAVAVANVAGKLEEDSMEEVGSPDSESMEVAGERGGLVLEEGGIIGIGNWMLVLSLL